MKNKKKIIIIILSIVILLLLLFITYRLGINAGRQSSATPDTEQTAGETLTTTPDSEQTSDETETVLPDIGQTADSFTVDIQTSNTWGENPVFSQLDITLKNDTNQDINGWTLQLNVGEDASLQDGWCGIYTIKDDWLIVTNEEHNAIIPANGSINIGVILSGVTGDFSYTAVASGTQPASGNQSASNTQSTSNTQSASGNQNNPDLDTSQNSQANPGMLEVPAPTTDDWLHVEGTKIVDSEGKQVWLTGVNWFGYNTGTNTFDGLWNSDLNTSIQGIADHGFNLIRVPMSAELILQWKNGEYPAANYNHATNSYLESMNSLEIFDYVIGQCRANGLKIMIDIHSAKTDSAGHITNIWYNGDITTEKYQEALVWMAARYANDDTIIAFDLKNEPHGKPYETDKAIWNDSTSDNNWKYVAEQTALMVLKENPNVLIMIEGTEIYPVDIKTNGDYSSTADDDYYFNWWGGNLRGVADYPIELGKYQDQLVYSPHDYGPTVYNQPWFYDGYDYDSLYEDCWHDNWLYIYEDKIAPLLIGEWGGFMTEPNLTWMTHMRTLISEYHLHHTFWCYNANSGDTGGLVKDDFTTWDEEKYAFVKEVLWQENGKFVGLDHEIPLGTAGNGITLSDAKGLK